MHPIPRIIAVVLIFGATSLCWMILGGVTAARTETQSSDLRGSITDLWGSPQMQRPPELSFHWQTERDVVRTERQGSVRRDIREKVTDPHDKAVALAASRIDVDLKSDMRRKGLMWYSLYDVSFAADWRYEHAEDRAGELRIAFRFPDPSGVYDDFELVVDGVDLAPGLSPTDGVVSVEIPVQPGQSVAIAASYRSRGMDRWTYQPSTGVALLKSFELGMTTDFADIDFPEYTLSPSKKTRNGDGWTLDWEFKQVVTGQGIGMVTPSRIQPGELASELSLSAPISLFFFFVIIYVFATLRRIDIHPINYLFLGSAFFAFHLLFAYLVDHTQVIPAFVAASAVSLILVVTYLRLVVSNHFALREAALAQLLYLVGFSVAHFWEGFTGLTVTILAIATLFAVMQLTGRVNWTEALANRKEPTSLPASVGTGV